MLRPQQVTLGSLVLASRQPVQQFSALDDGSFSALGPVIRRIEAMLRSLVQYEKLNYLMLMMVDPDVHFHVIPRYSGEREFGGLTYPDAGWPGPPNLGEAIDPGNAGTKELVSTLRKAWAEAAA